ncbi:MAG: DNA/RNA non-specific endonuclease [Bacteroidaceae bacterium]|nr:DNA/RNA non-specific endonuclease [Bacteroidaceae bacterium]
MARRKSNRSALLKFLVCIAIAVLVSLFIQHRKNSKESGDGKLGMELAIPQFTKSTKSQVIEHIGYTVSYNEQRRNPNWVAYELTSKEVDGKEPRGNKFIPDPAVIGRQAVDDDYKHSGWDRGHLAPAADMKWSEQAMDESFYLSNISPQDGNLNRGVWKSIEELTRDNAHRYGEILVVTGPVFTSKEGLGCIGENRVLIPNAFYKVLLAYDNGYTGIGFYCENVAGKKKLQTYAKSIDEIEEITGIDFFHKLPDDIETEVEHDFDWEDWKTQN